MAKESSNSFCSSKVSSKEKEAPYSLISLPFTPQAAWSYISYVYFIMEHFWALPFLADHFSNITQDIMSISGFKIILCISVIRLVLFNICYQGSKYPSN